ncbi:MAG: hypothetical protein ABIA75_03050, partial [Candidatus Neomarinimicrobiota bacterium]
PQQLLQQFEELSERLGIRLVEDKGDFAGGSCRVREEACIVINKHRPIEQQLRVLAGAFGEMDLSAVYLMPNLRAYIEEVNLPLFETQTAENA